MTEKIGICIVGAAGRMGIEVIRAASSMNTVRISGAVERPGTPVLGRDAGELAGCQAVGVPVEDSAEQAMARSHVVVDFSVADAVPATLATAVTARKPFVCGTTGLSSSTNALFDEAAKLIPVLVAPNLSPGITVLTALVERAIRALGGGYDVEVVEVHHRDKVDAPSGTALQLARAAARTAGLPPDGALRYGRQGRTGRRPNEEIGIHAVRGGGVFGDHIVILAGRHEVLEFTHRALSRTLLADGAIRAAVFMARQKPGRYTMADVLGLSRPIRGGGSRTSPEEP